jgi:hypothetical protein
MGKSERLEGQESLHTAGGPTGYLCSTTRCHAVYWPRFGRTLFLHLLPTVIMVVETYSKMQITCRNISEDSHFKSPLCEPEMSQFTPFHNSLYYNFNST